MSDATNNRIYRTRRSMDDHDAAQSGARRKAAKLVKRFKTESLTLAGIGSHQAGQTAMECANAIEKEFGL